MKLVTAVAGSMLLAIAGANAQSTTTTPPAQTAPANGATTAPKSGPAATAPSTGDKLSASMAGHWYTANNNEMRASKIIGTTVRNAANESVGEVNEILLDSTGKVAAVVIGVGGFLGLGEREVAVTPDAVKMTRDANGNLTITMDATKEILRSAPVWTANVKR